jgi:hypothetical protein
MVSISETMATMAAVKINACALRALSGSNDGVKRCINRDRI